MAARDFLKGIGDAMSAGSVSEVRLATKRLASVSVGSKLEAAGVRVSRYGLVVVLLLIGALKFTAQEAAGIQPLVVHSPLMSWMYAVLSVRGVSNLIGVTELIVAALIALRPVFPKASFVGSLGTTVTFLLTISFLFSTPGAVEEKAYGEKEGNSCSQATHE